MTEIKRSTKYQNHINRILTRKFQMLEADKTFYISDPHFFHQNIIKYCDRPWETADKMNKGLIEKWNDTVPEDADVICTGDISFLGNDKCGRLSPILSKLKGRIHLICGNHDRISHTNYVDIGIQSIHYPYLILPWGWICLHDPALATACPPGSIVISGHVHNLYGKANIGPKGKVIIDVGVDAWDYTPVSTQQIKDIVYKAVSNGTTNN